MGFLNRKSGSALGYMAMVLLVVVLFSITAVVAKLLIYAAPFGLLAWCGYKLYRFIQSKFMKDRNITSAEVYEKSYETIEEAINHNQVIDVEYSEI